jgi:hypothetical protein
MEIGLHSSTTPSQCFVSSEAFPKPEKHKHSCRQQKKQMSGFKRPSKETNIGIGYLELAYTCCEKTMGLETFFASAR